VPLSPAAATLTLVRGVDPLSPSLLGAPRRRGLSAEAAREVARAFYVARRRAKLSSLDERVRMPPAHRDALRPLLHRELAPYVQQLGAGGGTMGDPSAPVDAPSAPRPRVLVVWHSASPSPTCRPAAVALAARAASATVARSASTVGGTRPPRRTWHSAAAVAAMAARASASAATRSARYARYACRCGAGESASGTAPGQKAATTVATPGSHPTNASSLTTSGENAMQFSCVRTLAVSVPPPPPPAPPPHFLPPPPPGAPPPPACRGGLC